MIAGRDVHLLSSDTIEVFFRLIMCRTFCESTTHQVDFNPPADHQLSPSITITASLAYCQYNDTLSSGNKEYLTKVNISRYLQINRSINRQINKSINALHPESEQGEIIFYGILRIENS